MSMHNKIRYRSFWWGPFLLLLSSLLASHAHAQRFRSALPPLSEFSVIEEKNLFHPDRIPQMPLSSGNVALGPIESPPENFVLHGVIILDEGKHIALIEEPTFTEKKVKSFVQGDQIGPYVLKVVKNDGITLSMGGREFEVSLYKKKESSPQPPTAPGARPLPPRPRIRPRPLPPVH